MTLASSEELQDYQSSGLALSEVQLEDIEGICGDFLEPSTLASTENKRQKTYEDDLDFQPCPTPVSRALNEPVLATQDLLGALDEVGFFEPTQEDPLVELSLTQSTGKKKVKVSSTLPLHKAMAWLQKKVKSSPFELENFITIRDTRMSNPHLVLVGIPAPHWNYLLNQIRQCLSLKSTLLLYTKPRGRTNYAFSHQQWEAMELMMPILTKLEESTQIF
ncbi:hypothetical protein CROQUDRAFT_94882 [Cronartium quercuum f. sp. fusiforme G11]|uniref:Uncharacterized protein n=1 Tax=Cronartium quercuum f. sp. fusiforme G11 TaxID=708437 RepID=A0A9P6T9Z5_9BASI|nr:hypothetical protein CROQUDRAFT_94882 [Cronartium quercuum f. sp. fusiforme G11]